ncbi:hypothetical protein [Streptomyces sp. NPDC001604]|uniref:hypothetical protein n=1 Tax=Streptomyces sp. NPDC001604 TaxID=3364593 RepID=UPI003692FC69
MATTLPEQGLFQGRIHYDGAFAVLNLHHAPAPWLVGHAAFASAYNTACERVSPGALAELGIPVTVLTWRKA